MTSQFRRVTKESGIDAWERYTAAEKTADRGNRGQDWLTKGVDPDSQ